MGVDESGLLRQYTAKGLRSMACILAYFHQLSLPNLTPFRGQDFWKGGLGLQGLHLRSTSKKKGGSRRGSNFGPNFKKPIWWPKKGGMCPPDPPMALLVFTLAYLGLAMLAGKPWAWPLPWLPWGNVRHDSLKHVYDTIENGCAYVAWLPG